MAFEIVTDSSSNLTDDIISVLDINMISYFCSVNDTEYACYEPGRNDEQFAKTIYDLMREKARIKTTLVNTQRLADTFEKFLADGKDVLFIGMSGGLTGTMHSATLAAEEMQEKYPDRKCIAIDSIAASLGEGIQVCEVAQMRNHGKTIEECVKHIEDNRLKMISAFTVDDLIYLKNGGRISGAAYFAGTLLNIKPLLRATDEGKIALCGKVRGRKKSLDSLVEWFVAKAVDPENQVIGIAHGDCLEDAIYVKNEIEKHVKVKDCIIRYYDICTGAHVGPGTVALFFKSDKR